MLRPVLIPALALGAIATTPAAAEEHVWRTGDGFTVRGSDLDLDSAAGRAALLRRLDHAAAQICREVTPRISRRECTATVTAHALAAAPHKAQTAIAAARLEKDAPRLAGR